MLHDMLSRYMLSCYHGLSQLMHLLDDDRNVMTVTIFGTFLMLGFTQFDKK